MSRQVIIGSERDFFSTTPLFMPLLYTTPGIAINTLDEIEYSQDVITTPGFFKSLRISTDTPPGVGESYTFTVYKGTTATNLSVVLSDLEQTGFNGTAIVNVDVQFADRNYIRMVATNSTPRIAIRWSLDFHSDNPNESMFGGGFNFIDISSLAPPNNEYVTFFVGFFGEATPAEIYTLFPLAGSIKNFYVSLDGFHQTTANQRRYFLINNESRTALDTEVFQEPDTDGKGINDGDLLSLEGETSGHLLTQRSSGILGENTEMAGFHQVIHGRGFDALSTTVTEYNRILVAGESWNPTSIAQVLPADGTFENLRVNLSEAPGSGKSYNFRLMKNDIASNLQVTISGSDTTAVDAASTVPVVRGNDTVVLRVIPSGTPDTAPDATWCIDFRGVNSHDSIFAFATSTGTDGFAPPMGKGSFRSTEADELIMPTAGTIMNLYVQAASGTYTMRKNRSDTLLEVSSYSSGLGKDIDISHSFHVIAGDSLSLNGPGPVTSVAWVFRADTTKEFPILCGARTESSSDFPNPRPPFTLYGLTSLYTNISGVSTSLFISPETGQISNQFAAKALYIEIFDEMGKPIFFDILLYKNEVVTTYGVNQIGGTTPVKFNTGTLSIAAGDRISIESKISPFVTNGNFWSYTDLSFTFLSDTDQFPMFAQSDSGSALNTFRNLTSNQTIGSSATESDVSQVANNFRMKSMYVDLLTAPGGGETRRFIVRQNGADTALDVTISGAAKSGNISVDLDIADGDLINLREVASGGAAGGYFGVSYVCETPNEPHLEPIPINFYSNE